MDFEFHPYIVRAYDIRGTFGTTLFEEDGARVGYKIATHLKRDNPLGDFVVGVVRDGRHSSPLLHKALVHALLSRGIHVIDYGIGPSPMAYYAAFTEKKRDDNTLIDGIIMITASHNPKEDNGFKLLIRGESLCSEDLLAFTKLPSASPSKVPGRYTEKNIQEAYAAHTFSPMPQGNDQHVFLQNMKIAWDFSNGAMAALAPHIRAHLPGRHVFVGDHIDGDFPNHAPDPTQPHNQETLIKAIQEHNCDLGFAFDGDGDRLVVFNHMGEALDGDRLTLILARDVMDLFQNASSASSPLILADIKSSVSTLNGIRSMGGRAELVRTGHAFIKTAMKERSAVFAGEVSGHLFFRDYNFGYDDGLYAAVRMLCLLGRRQISVQDLDNMFVRYHTTPEIKISIEEDAKKSMMTRVQRTLDAQGIPYIAVDGVRVSTSQGWWLLRTSHTESCLVLRMEGYTEKNLAQIRIFCKNILLQSEIKIS